MIAAVKKEHTADIVSSTFFSAIEIIQRLEAIGWIRLIPIEPVAHASVPVLYLLDMEATEGDVLDPLELLQGYMRDGVLCYFGVLCHHGLTTQIAPFFHVAFLEQPSSLGSTTLLPRGLLTTTKPNRNPLGTEVFKFEGASCYITKRNPTFVPGIQTRIVGGRTILRMTTIEQTLLDTLGYPQHCGGEEVVFEAWERGAALWNADRFAGYLEKINRPEIDRRVGAILETMDLKTDSQKLNTRLKVVRARLEASNTNSLDLQLLPDFSYSNLNRNWRVYVP